MLKIFVGLSSFQALAMFRRGIFYTFLAVYLRSYLGLSVTETTLIETIPMVLNILFQTLVWGKLTDKLQLRRTLIVTGELLASVGHVLMWFFHSITPDPRASGYVIIAGLSVIEIFWSMSNIGWSAYISDVYTMEQRNSIQGKFASIGGMGRIVGAVAGGLLYDGMQKAYPGWGFKEGGIFFAAAAAMLVSVIPLLFIPEGGLRVRPRGSQPHSEKAEAGGKPGLAAGVWNPGVFAFFLAAMLLINSGINSIASFRAMYLNLAEGFAASSAAISGVVNAESAALIVTGFFLGMLGRKIGIQKLLLLGTASAILSLVIYVFASRLEFIYCASVFKGFSDGAVLSSSYAYASLLIPPEKRGRYFAIFNSTFFLSWGVTATLLTGPLIDILIRAGKNPVFAYKAGIISGIALIGIGLAFLLLLFRQTAPTRKTARSLARM